MIIKTEPEDAIINHPMELQYMISVRSQLAHLNCWPYHVFEKQKKRLFLRPTHIRFLVWMVVWAANANYVKDNFYTISFFEMGQTYLTMLLGSVGIQRLTVTWFKKYDQVFEDFILKMHLFYYRRNTEFSKHIYQQINKYCVLFRNVMTTLTLMGIIFLNLMPMYINYKNGKFSGDGAPDKKFEYSINFSLPYFDPETEIVSYFICAILGAYITYGIRCAINSFDLILCILVFHIWGHLKILDNSLRTLPKPHEMRNQPPGPSPDQLRYSKEENMEIAIMLKDIVNHHGLIIEFMNKMSDAFGAMLFYYFLFYRVSGCLLLLECSTDSESSLKYVFLTVCMYQLLMQVCIIVELLGSQSKTLKDAVYSVPWEYMDTSNRKIVLFILCNSQEPIYLKPLGLITVGVQTMASVLKMSISYFMFIRTFG